MISDKSGSKISRKAALSLIGLSACSTVRIPGGFFDPDIILYDGMVVDGTGKPAFRADVAVRGGKIQAIGDLSMVRAKRRIYCKDYYIAPGFIDLHSHSDFSMFADRRGRSKISQGVTTEIIGQDGRSPAPLTAGMQKSYGWIQKLYGQRVSWRTFKEYYSVLRDTPLAFNVRSMAGAGTIRQNVMGMSSRKASGTEIRKMRNLLEQAFSDGAYGLSSGLEYLPGSHADKRELTELARSSQIYSTHMRNEDDFIISAVQEAFDIAAGAGTALNLSHLKTQGKRNWNKIELLFNIIELRKGSVPHFSFDRYPYTAYNSRLVTLFPVEIRSRGMEKLNRMLKTSAGRNSLRPAVERKIFSIGSYDAVVISGASGAYSRYIGKSLSQVARSIGMSAYNTLCHLQAEGGYISIVVHAMSEMNLRRFLNHPDAIVASDGAALHKPGGRPHPRSFGTFPRVIGRYARQLGLFSIEEAVKKMTSLPAKAAGLEDRGRIAEGMAADICVFDPDKILDYATFDKPTRLATGMQHVLVNGIPVMVDRMFTREAPGRPV